MEIWYIYMKVNTVLSFFICVEDLKDTQGLTEEFCYVIKYDIDSHTRILR